MRVVRERRKKTKEQRLREKKQKHKRYHEVLKHDPVYKAKVTTATRNWQTNFPEKYILSKTKSKCKLYDIPFNLELSDIVIPKLCPVLGTKLLSGKDTLGVGASDRNLASIDRIVPDLGYTKGNIQIISMRANVMKSDSKEEDLVKFAKWILNTYEISCSDS